MRAAREIMAEIAGSGLTPEQQALVLELSAALAVEARPMTDTAADRRRAKDREYQRERRQNRQTSADSADAKRGPQTPKKTTPSSPPKGGSVSPDQLSEQLWELQPLVGVKPHRRATRPDVARAAKAALNRGAEPEQLLQACRAYYAGNTDDGGKFAMGAARLLEADRWRDFLPTPTRPVVLSDAVWAGWIDHWQQTHEWRGPGPPPDNPDCQAPPAVLAQHRKAA